MTSLRSFSISLLVVAALAGLMAAPAQAISLNCTNTTITAGTFQTVSCSASFGTPPYNFSIQNGAVPPGMQTFSGSAEYVIQGTPSSAGTYNFTVTVTDSGGSPALQQPVSITVNGAGGGGTGTGGLSLSTVSPNVLSAGVGTTLTISGAGFPANSTVFFNNLALTTSYSSSNLLFATLPASYAVAGTIPMYVSSPSGSSGIVYVTVSGNGSTGGGPTITSLSQTSVTAGSVAFTLFIYGSGFSQGNLVTFGSNTFSSTFYSSGQLSVTIPASAVTTSSTVNVSVGGSNSLPFTIGSGGSGGSLTINCSNTSIPTVGTFYSTFCTVSGGNGAYTWSTSGLPSGLSLTTTNGSSTGISGTPTVSTGFTLTATDTANHTGSLSIGGTTGGAYSISSLSPSSTPVGSGQITMIVNGSGFTPSSSVYFNNILLTTQYVSSFQLNAIIPFTYLQTAQTVNVVVITGGAQTNSLAFTVGASGTGGVSLSSITPSNVAIGSPATTVTLIGSGFTPGMLASFGSFSLNTTFVSTGQLSATIPSQFLASAQTYNVTVGSSNSVPFTVGSGSGGALTVSCFPTTGPTALSTFYTQTCSVNGGTAPWTWTVSGLPTGLVQSAYTGGSSVTISGTPVSAGAYSYIVQVTDNSASRLTGSQTITGNLGNSAYSVTSLSPSSVSVGSQGITLTVLGAGFSNASLVLFNGVQLSTQYVSSNQLNASLPSAYLTVAQTGNISVNTSGIVTNTLPFTIGSGSSGGTLSVVCSPGVGPSALNTFYSTTCTASGGSLSYNWSIPSGQPAYLSLSATTGSSITISGTPNVTSPYNFTVKVTDTSSPVQTGTLQLAGQTVSTSGGTGGIILSSLSPSSAPVNSPAVTMNVTGSGFSSNSIVYFDGTPIVTTFFSSAQLSATIPAGQLTFARSALVQVTTQGVGTSNGLTFVIGNGGTGIQLSISCNPGVGPATPNSFYTSQCGVNGGTGPYNWSVISGSLPTGLTLSPNGALSTISGYTTLNGQYTYTLQVTDGSSPTNSATLTFAGETGAGSGSTGGLSITSLSPLSAAVGSAAIILTVQGSSFTPASVVYLNGSPLATTYVSSSQLTATIPAANLTTAQTESITVISSGVTSNPLTFTVGTVATSALSISCNPTIGPSSAGSSYTTTCTATGGRAPYNWTGIGLPFGLAVTFSTSSTVQITGTLFAGPYNYSLQVTDSSTTPLTATYPFSGNIVGAASTSISSMSPISVPAGSGQFNLTISGSNFVSGGTVVQFGNTLLLTTVNSANQLVAVVPANLVTSPSTINVQLAGSGSSNTVGFFVTSSGLSGISPSSLTFTYGIGGTIPAAQTLSVSSLNGATGFSILPNGVANGINWLVLNQASSGIPGSVSVSVSPGALAIGTYTGSLSLTGFGVGTTVVVPVTLNIVGPPSLVPASTSLNLNAASGASTSQTVNVTTSDGTTSLPFTARATANNGGNWLSVSPTSGSTPTSLTVTANASGLTPSTYSGTITLTSTGSLGSQVSISVTLVVTAPATITASPTTMSFSSLVGSNPAPQTITVSASAGSAVNYTVLGTTQQGGGWLAATPTGTTPGAITVTINTSGLSAATYNGTVTITAPGTSNSPVAIPITLTLTNPPALSASPQSLSFTYQTGAAAPAGQTVAISAPAGAANSTYTVTANTSSGGNWLSSSPTTGNTPSSITASVNPAGLAAGTYNGTLTVSAPGATSVNIPVSLTVSNVPVSIIAVPGNLSFFVPGDGSTPPAQSITVVSSGGNTAFTASAVSQGGSWLSVTPSGTTPGSVMVTVNPAGLFPGQTYNGSVTITAPASNPSSVQVPVTLTVAPTGTLPLQVVPTAVYLSYPQGSGSDLQHVTVINAGGGNVAFSARGTTANCGSWLNVVTPTGSATASTPGLLAFNVNPTGLTSQTCHGNLAVTDGNGNTFNVPVYMAISGQAQAVLLSQTAMNFTAAVGGSAPAAQTFQVLNPGSGAMPWNITTQVLSGGTWLSVAPNSGTAQSLAQAGSPISVTANPQGMAAGTYYGTVLVTAAGTSNSPQAITVSFTVQPSGSTVLPVVAPNGVIITGTGGSSDTQTLTISNAGSSAVTYTTALVTDDGQSWLVASPPTGSVGAGANATVSLSANVSGLSSGLRHGTLRIAFSTNYVTTVDVQLAVSGSSGVGNTGIKACGSSNLATEFLSPAQNFIANARVAIPLQVLVKDCNGNTLSSSSTGVDVLTGGSDIHLSYTGSGIWTGTWTPATASPVVSLTAYAVQLTGGGVATGSVTATGSTGPALPNAPPIVSAVVNAGSFLLPGLVAPGTMVSIFGSGLADSQGQVFSTPFPNTLQGAQFTLRGLPLSLFYASDGQVNAVLPIGIPANERDQLIVVRDATQSVPVDLLVADVDPGVFATNQQGSGQGAILVGGTSQVAAPTGSIQGAGPATVGQFLSIFLSGLGVVSNPPADGSPSTGTSLTPITPVVTIGGVPATVSYSGLAPGEVGLYQVNVQIPAGVPTGDAVPVVVTMGNGVANPVTIAIK